MSKEGVERDLQYVRSVVDQAEKARSPAAIYYLWAAITLVGMSLIDFRPRAAPAFWALAGPLGGVASGYLGWRAGRRLGQASRREGLLHTLHWLGMMAAIFLVIPLRISGAVAERTVPTLILLVVALGYYTAGIHLERRLLFVGMVMAGCYLATIFVRDWPFVWTFAGGVVSLSLVVSALLGRAAWRAGAGDRP